MDIFVICWWIRADFRQPIQKPHTQLFPALMVVKKLIYLRIAPSPNQSLKPSSGTSPPIIRHE